MGPPWRIDPMTHRTMSERSYHGATSRFPWWRETDDDNADYNDDDGDDDGDMIVVISLYN